MSTFHTGNEKSSTPVGTSGTIDNFPSLPIDQEDEGETAMLGVDLLQKMDIEDITALRKHFFDVVKIRELEPQDPEVNMIHGLSLNKNEFIKAMDSVAGSSMLSLCAAKLFDMLDIDNSGNLQWEEVLDAIIEKIESPREKLKETWQPIDPNVVIYNTPHCRRESIVKIVPLETESTFCYAVISKLGRVGVYDGEFNLLDSYKIGLKPNEEATRDFNEFDTGEKEEKQHRRSISTWVTDAIFVPDTYALLFSSSDRSLHLYDATGLVHVPLCRIIGMKNVPTCLDYYSSPSPNKPSLLFIGDDHGDVTMMRFHQAKTTLFKKKHPDKLDNFYWVELQEQTEYVTYSVQAGVHHDVVQQISYCPDNETVLSCSNDPALTLVVRHTEGRRDPYIFKVSRGIKCFHLERSMHLLVTGSNDCVVRIWNQVVTKQPVVSLYGHKAPIVDVRVIKYMSSIVSFSKEGVVKMWDINDQYCQMTLAVEFPVFSVLGRRIEYGARSIYPGPSTDNEHATDLNNKKEDSRTSIANGSGLDEIETQISITDYQVRDEPEWNRDSIVVACCNHVAVLKLVPLALDMEVVTLENIEDGIKESHLLPPPAKEHYASVPSPWRAADAHTKTPEGSEESASTAKSSSSSSVGLVSKKTTPTKTGKRTQANFKPDAVRAPAKNMNTKRTQYRIKQEQMKMLVEQCAPHLALDLHELDPIKFSKPLPVTRRMREKGVDVSDPERLMRARIQRDSTIMSLGSSSEAPTPRSSKSSKSAVLKKRISPSKGRLTPDWFSDKIKSSRPESTNEGSVLENRSK